MRSPSLPVVASVVVTFGLLSLAAGRAEAGKPRKQEPARYQAESPTPVPMHSDAGVVWSSDSTDCQHKCSKKCDRKCRHECAPLACPPRVEYKGCPAPCSADRIVTVTHPKTCTTIDVIVRVPTGKCEKIDRDRDGDMELDYGKYEVTLNWKDGGRRLVVDYDD